MQLAMDIVPGASFESFWTAVAAAWIAAAFGTLLVVDLQCRHRRVLRGHLLRIKPGEVPDPEVDGVLFMQMDGVAFPVMQWALNSGTMPTLRRWLDTGSHVLHEWTVQLPCTTPASQQAILMGTADGVPAFRWYDRELGRVLVANRPEDAAIIESRASRARAACRRRRVDLEPVHRRRARAAMTMSRLEVSRGSRRTRAVVARFLLRPDGLSRSLYRTLAEVVRERFQAVRQKRLDVHPRVHRSWTFAGLRAFSNGLLRDLNTTHGLRGDDARRPQHLRRLRGLRRDRPPRRRHPDRVPGRAGRPRPGAFGAGEGGGRAPRRYHFVAAERPRPVDGATLRGSLRHGSQ